MRHIFYLSLLTLATCSFACNGDFRERAKGDTREFVVVMDSVDWDSKTSNALRETFGKYVFTLPNPEPYYDLTFMQIRSRSQLERIMGYKNIIFAAPIDDTTTVAAQVRAFLDESTEKRVRNGESFAFPLVDLWYKDQYALILSSSSDSIIN